MIYSDYFFSIVDCTGKKDCLTFKLYYTDMFNVPRGYIRYLSWNLFVIPNDERTPAVNVSGETSYSAYYAQAQADTEGYEMITKIPVHEVSRKTDTKGYRMITKIPVHKVSSESDNKGYRRITMIIINSA